MAETKAIQQNYTKEDCLNATHQLLSKTENVKTLLPRTKARKICSYKHLKNPGKPCIKLWQWQLHKLKTGCHCIVLNTPILPSWSLTAAAWVWRIHISWISFKSLKNLHGVDIGVIKTKLHQYHLEAMQKNLQNVKHVKLKLWLHNCDAQLFAI